MSVAKEILDQINAADPAAMFDWGADDIIALDDGVQFETYRGDMWQGVVQIKYDENTDLYDVIFIKNQTNPIFGRFIRDGWEVVKEVTEMVFEDVINVIDTQVG